MKTGQDFLIGVTDHLLLTAPDYGVFDPSLILNSLHLDTKEYNLSVEETRNFDTLRKYITIISYAKSKGYIDRPIDNTSSDRFELTELGRNVKRKGGHLKYWEYVEKKEQAIFDNLRFSKEAAGAAIESAKASKDAVDVAKDSAHYSKVSMILIAIYTIITIVIAVTGIYTCNQAKREKNGQSNATNSIKEATVKRATNTIK